MTVVAQSTRRGQNRARGSDRKPRRPALRWTTPGRIRALAAVCLLTTVVVFVVTAMSLSSVRSGLSVIGHRTSPEVVSASGVYFALNDMDAQVANILLVANQNLGGSRQDLIKIYETDRLTVDHNLQQIASLAANDPASLQQVRAVLDGLGSYEALAAQAMLLEEPAIQPARPPAAALSAFTQATQLMHANLLPAAKGLIDANGATLNRTYTNRRASTGSALLWVVLLGGIMIGALLVYQLYLTARMRRVFNAPLALATFVAAALVIASALTLSAERHHLKVAKQDAFDSIIALTQARAVSYDANADESRYLVDPSLAPQYQHAFFDKSQQVLQLPGTTIFSYDAALASAMNAYQAHHSDVRFNGFFGTEFRNITFNGERAAAEQTLARWQTYQRDDRRIRALNTSGNLTEAVRFDTSHAPADSNGAFDAYDAALTKLIGINQQAFDKAIKDGENGLQGWSAIPLIACLLVAGLVVAGTWPRLNEYA